MEVKFSALTFLFFASASEARELKLRCINWQEKPTSLIVPSIHKNASLAKLSTAQHLPLPRRVIIASSDLQFELQHHPPSHRPSDLHRLQTLPAPTLLPRLQQRRRIPIVQPSPRLLSLWRQHGHVAASGHRNGRHVRLVVATRSVFAAGTRLLANCQGGGEETE